MLAIHLISFYFSKLKEDPTKKVKHLSAFQGWI